MFYQIIFLGSVRDVGGNTWVIPLSSSFFYGILPVSSGFDISQAHCSSVPGQEDCGYFLCLLPHYHHACHRDCTWLQDETTYKAPRLQSLRKCALLTSLSASVHYSVPLGSCFLYYVQDFKLLFEEGYMVGT